MVALPRGPGGSQGESTMQRTHRHHALSLAAALLCGAGMAPGAAQAQTRDNAATATHGGSDYPLWKGWGSAPMTLPPGGRYSSQWNNSTKNWVGGKGWNPGGPRAVNSSGYYGVNDSQNSYL